MKFKLIFFLRFIKKKSKEWVFNKIDINKIFGGYGGDWG